MDKYGHPSALNAERRSYKNDCISSLACEDHESLSFHPRLWIFCAALRLPLFPANIWARYPHLGAAISIADPCANSPITLGRSVTCQSLVITVSFLLREAFTLAHNAARNPLRSHDLCSVVVVNCR